MEHGLFKGYYLRKQLILFRLVPNEFNLGGIMIVKNKNNKNHDEFQLNEINLYIYIYKQKSQFNQILNDKDPRSAHISV